MLDRLYTLLLLFKEYILFAFLIVVSLLLLTLNDNRQVKQLRAISSVLFGVVQEQVSFIPKYFRLKEENELLRRRNIELADEANRLREAKLESARLRGLVELKEESPFRFIAADIVGKNLLLSRNTLTLNVGQNDGVLPSMPVVNHDGLIGVVVAATQNFSVVNLLLNVDFRASAKVQRSRVDGIIAWDGSEVLLSNVPKTQDVKVGDVVQTSEYSKTYPTGIRIGIIRKVSDQSGSLFKRVVVEPSVDFSRLEEVFIVASVPNEERTRLEQSVISPRQR